MRILGKYIDDLLLSGRSTFTGKEAMEVLKVSSRSFSDAALRLCRKQRLACPRSGFYLILRPEDKAAGAPDPARWIPHLMEFLTVDYRISLLRSAAFHGSSHQAAMVFQVVAPKQIRSIEIGKQRIQFIFQGEDNFRYANRPEWLDQLKTDAGYAKVAGVELTILDSVRYFHQAAGLNGVAQVVKDIGKRARPRILAQAAAAYENSTIRRLGYLLEHFGYQSQAQTLLPYAGRAKSSKPLNPSAHSILDGLEDSGPLNRKWMLILNQEVEVDN